MRSVSEKVEYQNFVVGDLVRRKGFKRKAYVAYVYSRHNRQLFGCVRLDRPLGRYSGGGFVNWDAEDLELVKPSIHR